MCRIRVLSLFSLLLFCFGVQFQCICLFTRLTSSKDEWGTEALVYEIVLMQITLKRYSINTKIPLFGSKLFSIGNFVQHHRIVGYRRTSFLHILYDYFWKSFIFTENKRVFPFIYHIHTKVVRIHEQRNMFVSVLTWNNKTDKIVTSKYQLPQAFNSNTFSLVSPSILFDKIVSI